MFSKRLGMAVLKLAIFGTMILSCTSESTPAEETSGAGSAWGPTPEGGATSAVPILVDVDANQVMNATAGTGVGVFIEYKTGGHWYVWWTCDTSLTGYSCNYDIKATAVSGTIANAVSQGPDVPAISLDGSNTIQLATTTTLGVDGVTFDTAPGAIISLDATLGGAEDGSYWFFVQDGQVNGGYQGPLSDPLLLEPAPGGA
ncbi:MAG: hypothetical protein ABTD50_04035 [Polyangiaceae bacterium]|jgi:hypothetical protein